MELVVDQVYTMVHDGLTYNFFTSRMVEFAVNHKLPTINCAFPQHVIDTILAADTIEQDKLAALTEAQLEEPGTIVEWDAGHSVVDGNHRLIRRWQRETARRPLWPDIVAGVSVSMECWVWPESLWREFCFVGDMADFAGGVFAL